MTRRGALRPVVAAQMRCNPPMRTALVIAAVLIAALAACRTPPSSTPATPGPSAAPGAAAPGLASPAAPASAPPPARQTLASEQRRLAELFRGTPVAFTMLADGTLRVTVPLR